MTFLGFIILAIKINSCPFYSLVIIKYIVLNNTVVLRVLNVDSWGC